MLLDAMDSYQIAKREHKENVKNQYNDKKGTNGAVNYFRASGLGDADRKAIYKFFAHNLPTIGKTAQNLRQLENGDYVHDRYQTAWEEMGILISMEERLSSRDDEYLSQFPWELAGHYDGLLDVNIIRAHALGLVTVGSVFNEETEQFEVEIELDEAYANSIGFYDADGNYNEEYVPETLVADIKTMNPWGFKKLKEQADVSNIQGYIDQIMSYMYFHNTPYGSIYVESKDNNAVCEVQVLWKDLHDELEYSWDKDIHGELKDGVVRVIVTSDRFFGSETEEGVVNRLTRLWDLKEKLEAADLAGDMETIRNIMPARCSDEPTGFPCSWGHKTGKPSYCEFYDHCWNKHHNGLAVRPFEAVPAEFIWEFEEDNGDVIKVDSRKVPEGIDEDTFANLIGMGALKLELFVIEDLTASEEEEEPEEGFNEDNLFGAGGELKLFPTVGEGSTPTDAVEYVHEGKKAIDCVNCGKQVTYQKLANGGTKKCPHCKHTQKVVREEVTA